MSNWVATNELRWVKREYPIIETALQQKWHLAEYIESEGWKYSKTEWRDVPVVEEE